LINLLAPAINSDDADVPPGSSRNALGIESDDVLNYCFPKPGRLIANGASG
jgi:hypothetical protein